MEPRGPADDPENLHSKVLWATLSEVASRATAAGTASQDAAADLCCVICLDVVSDPCEARPCGHRNFDFLCLTSWLNHRPFCPLCKTEVEQVRYQFRDADCDLSLPLYATYKVPRPSCEETRLASQSGRSRFHHASANAPSAAGSRPRFPPRQRVSRPTMPAVPAGETEEDRALARRRRVYRLKLFSLHVGTNRITRYTDLTPQMFDSDPALISRARMWIRRELHVFDFLCTSNGVRPSSARATGSGGAHAGNSSRVVERSGRQLSTNAEFLLEYIVAILRTVDINGSRGQAEEMLQEFLGREHTRLFLHELRSWLRSPYMSLETWDANVQYNETKSTPAAIIRRSSLDDSRRDENDQGRGPSTSRDTYRGHSAPRSHNRRTGARNRWSPYSPNRSSRRDVAESSQRTT